MWHYGWFVDQWLCSVPWPCNLTYSCASCVSQRPHRPPQYIPPWSTALSCSLSPKEFPTYHSFHESKTNLNTRECENDWMKLVSNKFPTIISLLFNSQMFGWLYRRFYIIVIHWTIMLFPWNHYGAEGPHLCHHMVRSVTLIWHKESCPLNITVLPPFSEKVTLRLAKEQQSYTINLSLFLKLAAYQVAEVVLSASRDCWVVLDSLSISIRQCGFHCKEASTLFIAECVFFCLHVKPLRLCHFDVCITVAAPAPADTQPERTRTNPDVPFLFRNCLATFVFIDMLWWTWMAILFKRNGFLLELSQRYLMF